MSNHTSNKVKNDPLSPLLSSSSPSGPSSSPSLSSSPRINGQASSPMMQSSSCERRPASPVMSRVASPNSSPSMSSDRQSFTPPPRRVGASLPSPPTFTTPTFTSPSVVPSNLPTFTPTSPQIRPQRRRNPHHILKLSYEGLSELLTLLIPSEWSKSAHITDQASIALICYKLYVLSITIPWYSKLYYYYLPSCLLSDLVAVAILQLGWWIAFGRSGKVDGVEEEAKEDVQEYDETSPSDDRKLFGNRGKSLMQARHWKDVLHQIVVKTPDRLFRSYKYTALPFDTSSSTISTSPETPTTASRMARLSHFTPAANNGLGINAFEPEMRVGEEGRSLLYHWQNDDTHIRPLSIPPHANNTRSSAAHPNPFIPSISRDEEARGRNHNDGLEKGYQDEYHEDITLIQEDAQVNYKSKTEEDDYDGEHGTPSKNRTVNFQHQERKQIWQRMARKVFWITFRIFHVIACLIAIVFTVIAVGAYSAGRVVFTWQGAFDSSSQSGYLFGYAMTEFPHFLLTYTIILVAGTFITLLRSWVPSLIASGIVSSSKIRKVVPTSNKIRSSIVGIFVLGFLAICAEVRPPRALPATDLLIDGITATSAILLFSHGHTHPMALNKNTTLLYGQSNAFQPRLTPIDSEKIEHVFFLFLESADYLAWPYQPDQFCKHRNCEDIDPIYNKTEEFTPFFQELITNDKNTVFIKDFRTNIAYTIKSHLGSLCGIMPHVKDFVSSEAEMFTPTGCLPHMVKALNDVNHKDKPKRGEKLEKRSSGEGKWKTGWFQAQMTAYDKQAEVIRKMGFDEVWDVNTITAKMGKKEYTNYFGYSDEELHPYVWEWIDKRLENKEKIFMSMPGATMHHPFNMPPFADTFEYSKTEWVNKYLNVVKRTDQDLRRFFDNLKSRNLLDKSLIIMQGDHGPRIGEDGIYVDEGWYERIYRSPLVIRAPGLIPHQIEQDHTRPFLTIDMTPTILDALGVSPSLIKSFVGQSIFRARSKRHIRDSFHSQSRGAQFPHHLRTTKRNAYKAIRMSNGDTCAVDLNIEPGEEFFYCVDEGWRKVVRNDELEDGLTMGLYQEGSRQEKELIDYATEAKELLDYHLRVNADFWDVDSKKEQNEESMKNFLEAVKEQTHWR